MLLQRVRGLTSLLRGFHTSPAVLAKDPTTGLPMCKHWTERNEAIHSPDDPVRLKLFL